MARVFPGRYTAKADDEFVLFLIGMRINKPLRVHKWLPVFLAMRPMVKELEAQPERGMIGAHFGLWGVHPLVIQYWRSFEDLADYARNPDARHLPAWKKFNQKVRGSGDVGIWHETYRVGADRTESIYGNMPLWGMA